MNKDIFNTEAIEQKNKNDFKKDKENDIQGKKISDYSKSLTIACFVDPGHL